MAPFGYKKHPEIKNKLMIDEETAWIVRKIFNLAFHGLGIKRIANTLMDEKIPCPGWFQYTRNGGCARFFIARILHDEKVEAPAVYQAR